MTDSDEQELAEKIASNRGINTRPTRSAKPGITDSKEVTKDADLKAGTLTQWSLHGNHTFVPTGTCVKKLDPGLYEICSSTSVGLYFERINYNVDGIIRFPDTTSDEVLETIFKFWDRETAFKKFNLPFKRGVLLWGPPGSGKCVVKGTLIPTSIGLLPIEKIFEIFHAGNKIQVLSEDGHKDIQDAIDDGDKESFKITLDNGAFIEGSERHKIRVLNNNLEIVWKRLDEISIDDNIICIGRTAPSSSTKLEEGFAYFCGLITGDGGISVNKNDVRNRVFFVVNSYNLKYEHEYIDAAEKAFAKFLGSFNGWIRNGVNVYMTNRTNDDFSNKMINAGFFDFDKKNFRIPKRVPRFIMESSLEDMMQYLSGVVDTDGYVSAKKNYIELTINSEGLARDIQNICSIVGARTNLTEKFIKDVAIYGGGRHNINSYYWRLRITSFIKLKNAGFMPKISYKRSEFESLCNKDIGANVHTIIPFTQDGQLIKKVYEKLLSQDQKPGSRDTYHLFSSMNGKGVDVETIQKIVDKFPDAFNDNETIKYFLNNECYFTKVAQIEKSIGHMYDLSIKGSPTYVINGIISHNTCTVKLLIKDIVKRNGIVLKFCSPSLFMAGMRAVREIQPNTPIIVLMEDIDAIIENFNESEVINILDGVDEINKIVFLATTNYPEKLGERIINRPSRFDRRYKIAPPNHIARKIYFEYIAKDVIDEIDIEQWVKDTDGMSIAHLKELFVGVHILQDNYEIVINKLQNMKETPSSGDEGRGPLGFRNE